MTEAKARNPDIKLYGLPWAFPAWVGNGTGNPYAFPDMTADYVVKWVEGAQSVYNLNIDYVGPAPLHQELRFTARLRDRSGRKLWIEAHGESDEGVFVRAEALFLAVELTHFANHTNADD